MKKSLYLTLASFLFLFACSDDKVLDRQYASFIDNTIGVEIVDQYGNNILEYGDGWPFDLRIYYHWSKKEQPYNYSKDGDPNSSGFNINEDGLTCRMALNLPLEGNNTSETSVSFNDGPILKFVTEYKITQNPDMVEHYGGSSIVLTKVWLDGQLVWTDEEPGQLVTIPIQRTYYMQ